MDDFDFHNHDRIGADVDFDLATVPTRDKGPFKKRQAGEAFTAAAIEEIQHLQYQLFTERKQSLLIVLQAPWFVIPADRKWHRNAAVASIVLQTLRQMDPQLPQPTVDLEEIRRRYAAAAQQLQEGSP